VRAIITKQALQEGWDCPFAYVLCALAAGQSNMRGDDAAGGPHPAPAAGGQDRAGLLDACYVLCHDAGTGEVVQAIKQSLRPRAWATWGWCSTGWVEFRLRADATDYTLPQEFALELSGKPDHMMQRRCQAD
jgi:hypothetical protein